ncbi:MAG: trypsin-like peptidase domain-containing protein [Acidimicrobiia bacterium]
MTDPGKEVTEREWRPNQTTHQGAPPRDPWTLILGILGGVLLGTGVTFAILGSIGVFEEPTPPTLPPPPVLTIPPPAGPAPTLGETVTVAAVAQRVIPSTVFIEISGFLLGASGSGVIYGMDGYIITNHHVVEGAGSVAVVFADGARYPARVVGTDPLTDLAVLSVDREDLSPIDLGTSANLVIGEPAIAVGSPLGLDGGPTVTSGIVSAINRTLEVTSGDPLYGLVQTDAPIAPGSSGGALVDAGARLIGITTAIAVSDVGAEGLGFAVPVDIVVGVVNDLIRSGTVAHARLGIEGSTAWADRGDAEYPAGVGVSGIPDDSAFEAAGGQINDVIVEIAGVRVSTLDDLLAVLRLFRAGQTTPIRILRADADTTLDVVLGRLSP